MAIAIVPMQLQVSDRFTDEEDDWEGAGHPFSMRGAKSCTSPSRGRATPREKTWRSRAADDPARDRHTYAADQASLWRVRREPLESWLSSLPSKSSFRI